MIIKAFGHIKNFFYGRQGEDVHNNATEIVMIQKGEFFPVFPLSRLWLLIVITAFKSVQNLFLLLPIIAMIMHLLA